MNKAAPILVVGGAGYIGSHMCKALHQAGYTPVTYDNLQSGHRHAVKWGPLEVGDIRDPARLEAAFSRHNPQAVIHFAAHIEVGEGEKDPAKFYDNNVFGSMKLLEAMHRHGTRKIIFSSTCATYGDTQNMPLSEEEPQIPTSVYGRTKLAVEGLLESYAKAHDFRFAALRYFNASGADLEGEIGEEHDPETHLIPNALKAAAGLGAGLKLFGADYDTPDGTCIRDYIHVNDLAQAHLLALDALSGAHEMLKVNVGTGEGISVLRIIKAIERMTGRAVPYTMAPRRAGDVARLYADVRKARAVLGFKAQYSDIDTIIQSAWAFHSQKWGIS